MADSFFGLDTSLSNLNDDEGGGEPSEDEYDALNDETFGQDSDEFDWEVEHEHLAGQLESSRPRNIGIDDTANTQLEASLSQLVFDETDGAQSRAFGSSVWRHDPAAFPTPTTSVPTLKNVCTVEEIERQLRSKQQQQNFTNQSYFQPRFPPVILQRPPGLQAPVPLPFAPQQPMNHGLNNHNQSLNKLMGQSPQMNQMSVLQNHASQNMNQFMNNQFQNNPIGPSNMLNQLSQNLSVHQLGQNNQMLGPNTQMLGQNMNISQTMNQLGLNTLNQMGQNMLGQMMQNTHQMAQSLNKLGSLGQSTNQMAQNVNHLGQIGQTNQVGHNTSQMGQNVNINQMGQMNQLNQMGQNLNQMGQNSSQMGQPMNQLGQNSSQMGQPMNQLGQNTAQIGQTMHQLGQNSSQMGQSMNQLGQNSSQIGQPMKQMGQNSSQMGQNMNQMGQSGNQMMPNGNQLPPGANQFHMMGQPRMIAPPPGINMPRHNFSSNMGQFNPNFRAQSKPDQQMNQPNMMMNHQLTVKNQPQPITNAKHNSPNQMNQSPQSKMNSKLPKVEPKVQKSRIYSNSNNKNMTSQNLVQLIQNTHPMLQYNNFHNANHHPMLNSRSNVFNNQFPHPMFNNQRHNGSYSSRHSLNGDDASGSDCDDYAGLMTQREKQWLINIQMLQLNTGTPYIHDFYYTVFLERQASKEKEGLKEAHKANQQNHPFYSGGVKQETHTHRERHNSNRHNSTSEDGGTPRTYVPTQFENSLGKLQCGSVTAPRKIIDVEVVGSDPAPSRMSRASSVASTTHPQEVPREMKRTKQLLLDIEALYLILLRLEELNDPLAISNALILKEREEKQKQLEAAIKEALNDQPDESNLFLKNIESVQRRPKQDSPKSESIDKRQVVNLAIIQKPVPVKNLLDEDKDDLVNKIFAGLLHSDRLPQMLTVRKGKALVSRFLSRAPAGHLRLRALWGRVLRALPGAARRDDGSLAALAPHYRKYIQNTSGWSAILESCGLLAETLDPARTPYALTTSLTLSCVCALIERASILVNTPEATSSERQWSKFLKTLARALKHTTLSVARPHQRMSETKLMYHIKQLESRSTIEILQRGKTAEFADVTKTDVSEQLVKHLC